VEHNLSQFYYAATTTFNQYGLAVEAPNLGRRIAELYNSVILGSPLRPFGSLTISREIVSSLGLPGRFRIAVGMWVEFLCLRFHSRFFHSWAEWCSDDFLTRGVGPGSWRRRFSRHFFARSSSHGRLRQEQ
jgi:hypothetical protein